MHSVSMTPSRVRSTSEPMISHVDRQGRRARLQGWSTVSRTFVLVIAVACREPTHTVRPLPPLVAPTQAAEARAIDVPALGFTLGERMVWEVRLRGMTIGRAEIRVGDGEIRSRFATGTLASAVANVEHELVTSLAGVRPREAEERLEIDGKFRQLKTNYAGTLSHSLHTALGAIRAWAKADAPPGFLHVVVVDKLVRVDLQTPTQVQHSLRVDGTIVGLDEPASLTIWLDSARSVTRIEVRSAGEQITATPSF
jgi:hypothetical protein